MRIAASFIDRFVPFLRWLPELKNGAVLRADVVAGITVALVLIPQSMAYAQLAGLPPYYGLYAAFLPPMIAALFGSSRQLATGPVAVVSLLSAAALEPLATAGSEAFVAYSILLALLVGLFQITLGLLRLGVLVNFLSHPVVLGFTNAAAIIIATSQLSKIFGVSVDKAATHYETVWNTVVVAVSETHWPTLLMAVLAFSIMIALRRISPRIPSVLLAVVVTTVLAWVINFEQKRTFAPAQIADATFRDAVERQIGLKQELARLAADITALEQRAAELAEKDGVNSDAALKARYGASSLRNQLARRAQAGKSELRELKKTVLLFVPHAEGAAQGQLHVQGRLPPETTGDGKAWRIAQLQDDGAVVAHAGGQVVGVVPQGLPAMRVPAFDFDVVLQLLASAIAISLIGFMEAISIAKAMAARTRQRLDANQELVGQGLSNMIGSMFQSYAVSGSFSRSAVNIGAGAITGFSSVVTGLVVVVVLLWFTPLLYHLPQATLAAVIMMAVIGLVNFKAMRHIWRVQRQDGVVAILTFVLTLMFAPHLDRAIIVGVVLSVALFLYRTMKPRVVALSRCPDGSLRDAEALNLKTCPNISMIRFDGSLYFANTSYFEDKVLQRLADKPDLKFVIVDGAGINQIDSTGEEMLAALTKRLDESGIQVLFTHCKKQVMDVLKRSGFVEHVGKERFFPLTEVALDYAWDAMKDTHDEVACPLNQVCAVSTEQSAVKGAA